MNPYVQFHHPLPPQTMVAPTYYNYPHPPPPPNPFRQDAISQPLPPPPAPPAQCPIPPHPSLPPVYPYAPQHPPTPNHGARMPHTMHSHNSFPQMSCHYASPPHSQLPHHVQQAPPYEPCTARGIAACAPIDPPPLPYGPQHEPHSMQDFSTYGPTYYPSDIPCPPGYPAASTTAPRYEIPMPVPPPTQPPVPLPIPPPHQPAYPPSYPPSHQNMLEFNANPPPPYQPPPQQQQTYSTPSCRSNYPAPSSSSHFPQPANNYPPPSYPHPIPSTYHANPQSHCTAPPSEPPHYNPSQLPQHPAGPSIRLDLYGLPIIPDDNAVPFTTHFRVEEKVVSISRDSLLIKKNTGSLAYKVEGRMSRHERKILKDAHGTTLLTLREGRWKMRHTITIFNLYNVAMLTVQKAFGARRVNAYLGEEDGGNVALEITGNGGNSQFRVLSGLGEHLADIRRKTVLKNVLTYQHTYDVSVHLGSPALLCFITAAIDDIFED